MLEAGEGETVTGDVVVTEKTVVVTISLDAVSIASQLCVSVHNFGLHACHAFCAETTSYSTYLHPGFLCAGRELCALLWLLLFVAGPCSWAF